MTNNYCLRDFIWRTFENTGNVDTYIFYREIEEKNNSAKSNTMVQEEAVVSK